MIHRQLALSSKAGPESKTRTPEKVKMMNSLTSMRSAWTLACALALALALGGRLPAAGPPQATLANGQIRLKVYLPDARTGFYRGTRFDWSGVIASLEYKGHSYYGPWFDSVDPGVHDFRYDGNRIVASTCSGAEGPVEEFQTDGTALGFAEAKIGGTFVKIGVGVLRKDAANYDFVKQYEIVDHGEWSVARHADSIEFTQKLIDPASGYGYVYRKTVRLIKGKPEMILEHSLKNIGRLPIRSDVYDHNFLVLDHQPPGPDFIITLPFAIHSAEPPNPALAEIRGNRFAYLKTLQNEDLAGTPMEGFGKSPADNEIRIENRGVGAGMRIRGNRPLSSMYLWSIRTVLAVEPFIAMNIAPGDEFNWKWSYQYYTLPSNPK